MPQPDSGQHSVGTNVYFSNKIGQAGPSSSTTRAFLIEGRDDTGEIQTLIMNMLLKRRAQILSHTGYLFEKNREFVLCLTCELRDADGTPDDIVIKLRGLKHVKYAEALNLKNQMFDGLLFPLVLMGTNRVVAIKSNLTFDIQEKLKLQNVKSALSRAGRSYGKDIVSQIRQKFEVTKGDRKSPGLSSEIIQENIRGYMRATGWGKFIWRPGENVEQVTIQDPPTSSNGGSAAGNLFLQGLAAGLTEGLRNKPYGVMEDHYDSQTRLLTMTLIEESQMMQLEDQTSDKTLSPEQESRGLQEIDKIIDSVENKGVQEAKPAEEIEVPQVIQEKVLTVPSSESGNTLQVVLKRKNEGVQSAASPRTNEGKNSQQAKISPKQQEEVEVKRESVSVQPPKEEVSKKSKEVATEVQLSASGKSDSPSDKSVPTSEQLRKDEVSEGSETDNSDDQSETGPETALDLDENAFSIPAPAGKKMSSSPAKGSTDDEEDVFTNEFSDSVGENFDNTWT